MSDKNPDYVPDDLELQNPSDAVARLVRENRALKEKLKRANEMLLGTGLPQHTIDHVLNYQEEN